MSNLIHALKKSIGKLPEKKMIGTIAESSGNGFYKCTLGSEYFSAYSPVPIAVGVVVVVEGGKIVGVNEIGSITSENAEVVM